MLPTTCTISSPFEEPPRQKTSLFCTSTAWMMSDHAPCGISAHPYRTTRITSAWRSTERTQQPICPSLLAATGKGSSKVENVIASTSVFNLETHPDTQCSRMDWNLWHKSVGLEGKAVIVFAFFGSGDIFFSFYLSSPSHAHHHECNTVS